MQKVLVLALLLLAAANAFADEYIETWPDPLGGWRDRWVAQYTNMQNYYVCGGNPDEDYRGNNPCGIWPCDGSDPMVLDIIFDPAFGANITLLEMGLQAFTEATLTVYDMDNNVVFTENLTTDFSSPYGCYCTLHTASGLNGVSHFTIGGGGQVEGNMAIDDMRVITDEPTATQPTTWGTLKSLYR